MFNRLSFKGQPEEFTLTLGYAEVDSKVQTASERIKHGALSKETSVAKWTSTDPEHLVLERVVAASKDEEVQEERVTVRVGATESSGLWGSVVNAASYNREVQVGFEVQATKPALRSIELLRATGGAITTSLGVGIWSALDLSSVTRLRCNDGATSLWDANLLQKFRSLRVLNLSHAGLHTLPGVIGALQSLQELRIVGNSLKILPPELGNLQNLRILAADSNELAILPGELRKCAALQELTLENNRLTSVLLNFGALRNLRTLLLFGNPLEFLPEISPCQNLRSLSVANLRVSADETFSTYHVELLAPTSAAPTISISLFDSKPTDKLRPIFSLMLRRSSGHHPLLAGALRHLAEEDPKNRDLMARQENALQQLILMALNDDAVVVDQTCKTLALLAQHTSVLAEAIVDTDAGSLLGLMQSGDSAKQLASLGVVAAISKSSEPATKRMLKKDDLLKTLLSLATDAPLDVQIGALHALGNLAFAPSGKACLSASPETMDLLLRLAGTNGSSSTINAKVKGAAVRALAVLGDISAVGRAVGRSPAPGRGLRVLSLDGGGMKGMATVCLLRGLEKRTGLPVHEMFDLIVGTSTGGLLAVAMGLRKFTLDECEAVYKVLGQRVFSRPTVNKEKDESWMETFYRTFHSKTQHVRAVVVGYKHDATVYEALLKEYCNFEHDKRCLSDTLIDTACLGGPKIALVATLASSSPAVPFVFRNYELPLATQGERERMCYMGGSSKHAVWQAVRASSAAIYYLDDFTCGNDKFQDGAVVANNPGIIAMQEARALWPDTPIEVFISVGTGSTPTTRRDKGLSSYVDTGNILIESATSVDRVHEALATMTPLMPNMKYFRFNPLDVRCSMELDEIDPEKWAILETATQEFVDTHAAQFDAAAAALTGRNAQGQSSLPESAASVEDGEPSVPRIILGLRRGLLVISSQSLTASEPSALDIAAIACSRLPSCSAALEMSVIARSSSTPAGSPVPAANRRPAASASSRRTEHQRQLASPVLPVVAVSRSAPASPAATLPAPGPTVVEVDLGSTLGSMLKWFSPSKVPELSESEAQPSSPGPDLNKTPSKEQQQPAGGAQQQGISPASHPLYDAAASPSIASPHQEQPQPPSDDIYFLERSILDAVPAVGVVHLGLKSCSEGPVLRWKETFSAVTVPSADADALVRSAGADPRATSLSELFERQAGQIALGTTTVRAISTQYRHRPSGTKACVILVQHASPLDVLDVSSISRLRNALARKLVVSSDFLSVACLEAFVAAGCLAVLAPSLPLDSIPGCTGGLLSDFFKALYDGIQGGKDCAKALAKAETTHPALAGVFELHHR